jgi:hypothetical protein
MCCVFFIEQGFMNWNAVRHVPGSSSLPNADTIKFVSDQRGGATTMVGAGGCPTWSH